MMENVAFQPEIVGVWKQSETINVVNRSRNICEHDGAGGK